MWSGLFCSLLECFFYDKPILGLVHGGHAHCWLRQLTSTRIPQLHTNQLLEPGVIKYSHKVPLYILVVTKYSTYNMQIRNVQKEPCNWCNWDWKRTRFRCSSSFYSTVPVPMFLLTVPGTDEGPHAPMFLLTVPGTDEGPHAPMFIFTVPGTDEGPHAPVFLFTVPGTDEGPGSHVPVFLLGPDKVFCSRKLFQFLLQPPTGEGAEAL